MVSYLCLNIILYKQKEQKLQQEVNLVMALQVDMVVQHVVFF